MIASTGLLSKRSRSKRLSVNIFEWLSRRHAWKAKMCKSPTMNKPPPDLRHPWRYVLPSQKWRGVPLQTEPRFSENLNFSREFISNHIVSFRRNQALSHCAFSKKYFCTLACWIFWTWACWICLFFVLSWIWNHCNNWTTRHFHASRHHVFSNQQAIFHSPSHAV